MMADDREQCLGDDRVYTGDLFFFMPNPNGNPFFLDLSDIDSSVPWMIIHKEYVVKLSGGYWLFWLLGNHNGEPRLATHEGSLGWIRRVA